LARIERTVRFKAPLREVFAYIVDFSTLKEYNPSIREVRCLTPGLPDKGSRFELKLSTPVGSLRAVLNITDMEENQRIATRLDAFIPAHEERLFKADGEETILLFTIEFTSGWFLVGPLVDRLLVRFFAAPQADREIQLLEDHFDI